MSAIVTQSQTCTVTYSWGRAMNPSKVRKRLYCCSKRLRNCIAVAAASLSSFPASRSFCKDVSSRSSSSDACSGAKEEGRTDLTLSRVDNVPSRWSQQVLGERFSLPSRKISVELRKISWQESQAHFYSLGTWLSGPPHDCRRACP
jgi:hypothetical protein